jgi:hypothetical protein
MCRGAVATVPTICVAQTPGILRGAQLNLVGTYVSEIDHRVISAELAEELIDGMSDDVVVMGRCVSTP